MARVIRAGGSVRISADEALDLDVIAGNISASGSAAVGAAVAVPVVTKNTHAWVGNFTVLSGAGNDQPPGRHGRLRRHPDRHPLQPGHPAIVGGTTVHLPYQHGLTTGDQVIYDAGGSHGDRWPDRRRGLLRQGAQRHRPAALRRLLRLQGHRPGRQRRVQRRQPRRRARRLPRRRSAIDRPAVGREPPRGAGPPGGRGQATARRSSPRDAAARSTCAATGSKCPTTWSRSNDEGVVYSSGGGQVIGGLVDGREYFYKDAGGGWFQLLTKKSDQGGAVVDLTVAARRRRPLAQHRGSAARVPSGDAVALRTPRLTQNTTAVPRRRGHRVEQRRPCRLRPRRRSRPARPG